ncbi:MAG TPA: ABC transporter permease [Gemmatimonadaceae bacterium]|nr:ABC transporter permease [Gemmatimonadaceae bacterium]
MTTLPRIHVYRRRKGFVAVNWPELWEYRELLYFLVWRDVKVRYKQAALGAGWAVLQPTLAMVIFTVIFGRLVKLPTDGSPYPVFVYAGLLPWTFFSNAVSTASNSLVNNANVITKVYFPRIMVPLAAVGAGLVDFAVAFLLLIVLLVWYHIPLTIWFLMVPVYLLLAIIAAIGVGMILSALTVNYRDFRWVLPFLMQVWLYATPVTYASSVVPEPWRVAFGVNPMSGIVDGFRAAVLGRPPIWTLVETSALVAVVTLVLGLVYFQQVERTFVDVV